MPTTWEELEAVSKKLTTKDQAGLGIGVGIDRLGAFVVQNGGWWLKEDGSGPSANTPEVTEALQWVQENVKAGNFNDVQPSSTPAGAERLSAPASPR